MNTVETPYNEVLRTMQITLLYPESCYKRYLAISKLFIMARILKGGLSTNLLLLFTNQVCKKRVKMRHMTYINLGLLTNLLCEFGPMSFHCNSKSNEIVIN